MSGCGRLLTSIEDPVDGQRPGMRLWACLPLSESKLCTHGPPPQDAEIFGDLEEALEWHFSEFGSQVRLLCVLRQVAGGSE